jgi:hypothetical protein
VDRRRLPDAPPDVCDEFDHRLPPTHNCKAIIAATLLESVPPQLHFSPKPGSTAAVPCAKWYGESLEPTADSIRTTAVH